jgi:hypothetical protein
MSQGCEKLIIWQYGSMAGDITSSCKFGYHANSPILQLVHEVLGLETYPFYQDIHLAESRAVTLTRVGVG